MNLEYMDTISLHYRNCSAYLISTELHKKETCEAVTIIETPPLVIVGLVECEDPPWPTNPQLCLGPTP